MAEQALSLQLLCSHGGRSGSYLLHLARLQMLRGDYCSAAASLQEVLIHREQVLNSNYLLQHHVDNGLLPLYCSVKFGIIHFLNHVLFVCSQKEKKL